MKVVSRALTAALMAVALAAGAAHAQPTAESIPGAPPGASEEELPNGWHIADRELVWSSPEPVGMGGALVEFRSEGRQRRLVPGVVAGGPLGERRMPRPIQPHQPCHQQPPVELPKPVYARPGTDL